MCALTVHSCEMLQLCLLLLYYCLFYFDRRRCPVPGTESWANGASLLAMAFLAGDIKVSKVRCGAHGGCIGAGVADAEPQLRRTLNVHSNDARWHVLAGLQVPQG